MDNKINNDFLKEFNYWVSTLPRYKMKNITASYVVYGLDYLKISHEQAKSILRYSEEQGFLEKNFIIKCPECDRVIKIKPEQLVETLLNNTCEKCGIKITLNDIFVAYDLIKKPMTDAEIGKELNKRLNLDEESIETIIINILNKEFNLNLSIEDIENIEDWRTLIE